MTIAELYSVCVGEGGMSPEYFMHTLTFWEAALFAKGVHRRYRTAWETARYTAFYAAKPHCKDLDWDKMGKFVWEKEKEDEAPVDKEQELREIEEMRRRIAARDAMTEKERIGKDLFDIRNW